MAYSGKGNKWKKPKFFAVILFGSNPPPPFTAGMHSAHLPYHSLRLSFLCSRRSTPVQAGGGGGGSIVNSNIGVGDLLLYYFYALIPGVRKAKLNFCFIISLELVVTLYDQMQLLMNKQLRADP